MDTYFKLATSVLSNHAHFCIVSHLISATAHFLFGFSFFGIQYDEKSMFVNKWVFWCNWKSMEMTTNIYVCSPLDELDSTLPADSFNFSENHWKIVVWRANEQYHVPTTVEGRRHHGYASIYGSISVQNQNNDHFCLTNANICTHYFMPSNIKKQQRQPKFNMIHRNEIVIAFALWMLLYCWRMHAVLICGHHNKSIKLNELFYHIIYAKKVNPNASHRQTQAGSFIVFKNGWYCSGHFRRHPPLCASFHSNSLHKYLRSTLK